MRIIVISRPDYFEGEATAVNRLFEQGMEILHLRKPVNDIGRFRTLLHGIDPLYHSKIAIHHHHELADEFNISRLHYPEQQRQQTDRAVFERKRENGSVISSSIHRLDLLSNLPFLDYVFYGPVFNSISKPGYQSILEPRFRLPDHREGPRVIAIGGITTSLLDTVKQMNFDGAALLGAVWTAQV